MEPVYIMFSFMCLTLIVIGIIIYANKTNTKENGIVNYDDISDDNRIDKTYASHEELYGTKGNILNIDSGGKYIGAIDGTTNLIMFSIDENSEKIATNRFEILRLDPEKGFIGDFIQ